MEAGRARYGESLLRWRNFPKQAVLDDVTVNTRRMNLKRTQMFGPLHDNVLPLRRKLLHENKENIFDNFDSRNYSVIELESPIKRVETIKREKCIRPVLYPRSSSRKRLKDSPTEIKENDYDNQIASHLLDTSRLLSEDKPAISCSGGDDINLNQRGAVLGQRPKTLGASNTSIVVTDSCYFSPISPLSEPRCKDLSVIKKIDEADNSPDCEDITNVSAITGSIHSVHEQVSVAHINDEAVFCSTFCYPLHSTVLTSPNKHGKSDEFNMTTLIDSSATSCTGDQDSESGDSTESSSESNSSKRSSLFVCIDEETGSSCELRSPSPSPLSVCIEEMEQVDLSASTNNKQSVKDSLRMLSNAGRRVPIGRESDSKNNPLYPRFSVLGRTYSSKASGVGMIPSRALVKTGRDSNIVSERLPTEGRAIVLDNRFLGRRLKRQIGNTELNRRRMAKPETIVNRSSSKNKAEINLSTIDTVDSSRSTLFASRLHGLRGSDAYLKEDYTEVSIDIDLPGSALFSKESSAINNVPSCSTSAEIRRIFGPKLTDKISAIAEGSIKSTGQYTETIIINTSTKTKNCNKISSKPKYRTNTKNNPPSVRTHCLYCSEKLVRYDQTTHVSKLQRGVKEVYSKPSAQDDVHKCLAVDSMQLGRRKFLAKKVQHLRRALRNDGYTKMTTMGQL